MKPEPPQKPPLRLSHNDKLRFESIIRKFDSFVSSQIVKWHAKTAQVEVELDGLVRREVDRQMEIVILDTEAQIAKIYADQDKYWAAWVKNDNLIEEVLNCGPAVLPIDLLTRLRTRNDSPEEAEPSEKQA